MSRSVGRRSTRRPDRSAARLACPTRCSRPTSRRSRRTSRRCSPRPARQVSAVARELGTDASSNRRWRPLADVAFRRCARRAMAEADPRRAAYAWTLWPAVGLLPARSAKRYGLPWGIRGAARCRHGCSRCGVPGARAAGVASVRCRRPSPPTAGWRSRGRGQLRANRPGVVPRNRLNRRVRWAWSTEADVGRDIGQRLAAEDRSRAASSRRPIT